MMVAPCAAAERRNHTSALLFIYWVRRALDVKNGLGHLQCHRIREKAPAMLASQQQATEALFDVLRN